MAVRFTAVSSQAPFQDKRMERGTPKNGTPQLVRIAQE
jgi:hypothetical protein